MLGGIWGCILSELKEYTPRPPKKNSGRDFDFPPRPSLKRPKEGPAGPSFGNHPGVGRGDGADASLRTGRALKWNPINQRAEVVILSTSLSAPLRFAGAGGVVVGRWCCCRFNLCHCEERSGGVIRFFVSDFLMRACSGGHIGPSLRGVEGLPEQTELFLAGVWRRSGTEPAPYTGTGSRASAPTEVTEDRPSGTLTRCWYIRFPV